jgi:hypothetical protein
VVARRPGQHLRDHSHLPVDDGKVFGVALPRDDAGRGGGVDGGGAVKDGGRLMGLLCELMLLLLLLLLLLVEDPEGILVKMLLVGWW